MNSNEGQKSVKIERVTMSKKICILGLGYIGMPTAAMFASNGYEIVGVDVNETVVNQLNKGEITIEEPYLGDLVKQVVSEKRLRASVTPEEADVFIIAVPTPIMDDKSADMTYVESATRMIVPYLKKGDTIILESTSPPGTVEKLMCPILETSGFDLHEDLYVAHSPERVIPGKILIELVENNRIVGGINEASSRKVMHLYESFVKGEIYLTDATTAEMCKLMENTFRDVNISLANELAIICEQMGINAWDVIEFANKHPRVFIHQPGPGVGGHCLAVDPWFIVEKFPEDTKIIRLARETNDLMPMHVFKRLKGILGTLRNKTVTVLGITYKPDIDDLRESPILQLVELLEEIEGITLKLVDPYVSEYRHLTEDVQDALTDTDMIILGVNHHEFSELDFADVKVPVLDTRNFLSKESREQLGDNYYLIGKGRQL